MNSDKVFCGYFGLYPSYVARILNSVGGNLFLRVVQWRVKLCRLWWKFIAGKGRSVTYKTHAGDCFVLSSNTEKFALSFKKMAEKEIQI